MKVAYIADDGTLFHDIEDCIKHELTAVQAKQAMPAMFDVCGERTCRVADANLVILHDQNECDNFIRECDNANLDCEGISSFDDDVVDVSGKKYSLAYYWNDNESRYLYISKEEMEMFSSKEVLTAIKDCI